MSLPYAPNGTYCNLTYGSALYSDVPSTADYWIQTDIYAYNSTAFIDCCGGPAVADYTVYSRGCMWFCDFVNLTQFDAAMACAQRERIGAYQWHNGSAKTSGAGRVGGVGAAGWAVVATAVLGVVVGGMGL